jgi:hypothetical protein
MTLNQVVKRIKQIVTAHGQVKSFGRGLLGDFLTDQTTKYAAAYLQILNGNVSTKGHATTINFTLFILDLVHISEDTDKNDLDIQSDMIRIAMDVLAKMNSGEFQDWAVSPDNNMKLIYAATTEGGSDYLAGCSIDFSVRIFYTQNICAIP